jgi:hypothetical protein
MSGLMAARLAAVITLATWTASSHVRAPPIAATALGAATEDSVAAMLRDVSRTGVLSGLRWPRFPYYRDEPTRLERELAKGYPFAP